MQIGVDEVLPRLDLGVVLRDLAEDVEEEAVGELHDVRLGHARDALAAVVARVLEREADDPLRALAADRLDRDAGAGARSASAAARSARRSRCSASARAGLVLDPGVEVLGVLADDDEVDVVVAGAHARVRLARPQAGVEPELVAQRDVDRAEAGADRRRDRALERDLVRLDRGERLLGQRRARPSPSRRRRPRARPSSNATPVASSTRRVASVSSGPVPSPGIRVTRCAIRAERTRWSGSRHRSGTVARADE